MEKDVLIAAAEDKKTHHIAGKALKIQGTDLRILILCLNPLTQGELQKLGNFSKQQVSLSLKKLITLGYVHGKLDTQIGMTIYQITDHVMRKH